MGDYYELSVQLFLSLLGTAMIYAPHLMKVGGIHSCPCHQLRVLLRERFSWVRTKDCSEVTRHLCQRVRSTAVFCTGEMVPLFFHHLPFSWGTPVTPGRFSGDPSLSYHVPELTFSLCSTSQQLLFAAA